MGSESESKFTITLGGDSTGVKALFAAVKTQVKSDVSEIEAATNKIELFKNVKQNAKEAATAFFDTKKKVDELKTAIEAVESAGGTISKSLTKELKDAERAAAAATKELDKQTKSLTALRSDLNAAGVNTKNLALEERRLAIEAGQVAAAEEQKNAKLLLGIKTMRDVAAQIKQLETAYATLKTSGTLSTAELAAAQGALKTKLAEIRGEVAGVSSSFKSGGTAVTSFFAGGLIPAIALSAAVGAVVSVLHQSIEAAREWRFEFVKLTTILPGTDAEVKVLTDGVRRLSRELGFNAVEGARALYDILRAGIPKDNALEVLAVTADAAKASLTDIASATKLATQLTKTYGLSIEELRRVFDVMFQGQKNAGATLKEFGDGIGDIAPIAKAAKIPLDELIAAVNTMVQSGLDAPSAIGGLAKVIAKLQNPEVVKNLRDMGVEVNGLVGTLENVAKKGLNLNNLLGLGLANEKSLKGLAALTDTTGRLSTNLAAAGNAAGALKAATDKLDDTPQERTERFDAAVKDLKVNIGEAAGATTSKFLPALTDWINKFNTLTPATKQAAIESSLLGAAISLLPPPLQGAANALRGYIDASSLVAANQRTLSSSVTEAAKRVDESAKGLAGTVNAMITQIKAQADGAQADIDRITTALGILADSLSKSRTQSQAAATQALADVNTRAAAQVAGLEKVKSQELASAAALVAIQQKQAADRLNIIQRNAQDIIRALDAEGLARRRVAEANGIDTTKLEGELTQARINALAPVKAAIQTHYADLLGIAKGHADKIADLEQQRVALTISIEDQIREVRRGTLTAYQAYQDRVKQIDELTAKAREELSKGDKANLNTVEELAQRARGLVNTLSREVTDESGTLVSAADAQRVSVSKLTDVQTILTTVIDKRIASEEKAGEATKDSLEKAKTALESYTTQYDELVAKLDAGITIKINKDSDEIQKELNDLDSAIQEKKFFLDVKVDLESVQRQITLMASNLRAGATEAAQEQAGVILTALQAVADKAPQLTMGVDTATVQIDTLALRITQLETLKPQVQATINSNVGEVQEKINKLKEATQSTHTVNVVVNNPDKAPLPGGGTGAGAGSGTGFKFGGVVGAVQAFARGGSVFRRPSWSKVPGSGDRDSVPAALRQGSFVIRKSASQYYGDGIMSKLARGYFGGGIVTKDEAEKWAAGLPLFGDKNPFGVTLPSTSGGGSGTGAPVSGPKGFKSGDSFQNQDPPVNFDSRPIPDALLTAMNVLAYAREMLNAVGSNNPLLGSLKPAILSGISAVERNPADKDAVIKLLQAAETIGANPYVFAMWGKTTGAGNGFTPIWFIDWLEKRGFNTSGGSGGGGIRIPDVSGFAKQLLGMGAAAAGAPNILSGGGVKNVFRRFADGGHTDTVDAVLTPGEWVIKKPAVDRYGSRLMSAINSMEIPRHMLARMMTPGPIARFAEGGQVGASNIAGGGPVSNDRGIFAPTVNINANAGDLLSADNVRRFIVPVLNDLDRKGR